MENKYLKYKQKYLNLKNFYFKSIGGVGPYPGWQEEQEAERLSSTPEGLRKTLRENIESRDARLIDLTIHEEQLERNESERNRINDNITLLRDRITILNNEISRLQIILNGL